MKGERIDLISRLPIDVVRRILWFLPVKDAIRTRVLSTLWRSVWEPVHVTLEVNSNEEVVQVIDEFLKSHEDLQQWKFHFRIPKTTGLKMKDDLILTATTRREEDLYLHFNGGIGMGRDFDLSLRSSRLSSSEYLSLKTLHLRSVNSFSGPLVSNFFSNTRFLESLSLENCRGLKTVYIHANGHLRQFEMVDCPEIVCVTLFALNLKSFRYKGTLCLIQLNDSPSLVDVVLDLREGPGEIDFDRLGLSLLQSLGGIKTLTISSWLVERLCTSRVILRWLQSELDSLKELCWVSPSLDQQNLNSLARFLNIVPFLERLLLTRRIDQGCCQLLRPFFLEYSHEPQPGMANASKLNHLEVVQLVGFTETKDELLLLDLLLKKAGNRSWRVAKIPLQSDETNMRPDRTKKDM